MVEQKLHIVMFPWLAFGHFIPYLHLSNKLAERGHKITFLLPHKAKLQLDPSNLHPSLITLRPFTVPPVDTLPPGAQTTADVPLSQHADIAIAMDWARPEIESIISGLGPKPDFVFYDMAHWVPEIAGRLGIKSVSYNIVCAVSIDLVRPEYVGLGTAQDNVPDWTLKHEKSPYFGEGVTILQRAVISLATPDAIAIRTCREIEGDYCDRISARFNKPVLQTGPALPEPSAPLEARWEEWLGRFKPGSVVFCCLGSQHVLDKAQLQELVLGLELTELPFLVAVKPPVGTSSLEEVLPEGFLSRVRDRGVIHGGWVDQPQILAHPSVGCFVSHCGSSSMWEGLVCGSQLVLLPQLPDQALNAKMMEGKLKVGVKVKREEDGGVLKEDLCEAIKSVMDKESEIGDLVRENHDKYREILTREGFMDGYIDNFIKDLLGLIVN